MKIPIWKWDPKQKRYIVFPFHLLEKFEDGRIGFKYRDQTAEQARLLFDYEHLFETQAFYPEKPNPAAVVGGVPIFFDPNYGRCVLKNTSPPPGKKAPKWYSKDQAKITSFQRKRK
jgi:hypothetical protein